MLDWGRVKELYVDLGPDDFDEVTAIFLEEVEEKLEEILAGQIPDLAAELHFLKGSAANLGFDAMRAECASMEKTLDATVLPELKTLYNKSKAEFLRGLAENRLNSAA